VEVHDFESDQGWTVGDLGDNATTGVWERCDPQATVAQPEDDHTPDPGVNAYITQCAAGSGQGSYDVDGGKTTLLSPDFDLSDEPNAYVRYYRWYSNDTGASPETDDWVVDVSADAGSTWVNLETLSSSDRTWRMVERNLEDYIALTSQVKFRFIARDDDPGSIVEAGVDDFSIVVYEDAYSGISIADGWNGDHTVLARSVPNPFAGETLIRFMIPAPGCEVRLEIFDVRGRKVTTLFEGRRLVGKHTARWDGKNDCGERAAGGVYFYQLSAEDFTAACKLTIVK